MTDFPFCQVQVIYFETESVRHLLRFLSYNLYIVKWYEIMPKNNESQTKAIVSAR